MSTQLLLLILIFIIYILFILYLLREQQRKQALFNCAHLLLDEEYTSDLLEEKKSFSLLSAQEKDFLRLLSMRLEESSRAEVLKKEAELHALQNQINPHFLYNRLKIPRAYISFLFFVPIAFL